MNIFTRIENLFRRKNDSSDGDIVVNDDIPVQGEKPLSTDLLNPITLIATADCTDAERAGLIERQNMLNRVIVSKFFNDKMYEFSSVKCLPKGKALDEFLADYIKPRNLYVNYYTDKDPEDENVDGYEESDEPGTAHLHREAIVEFEFTIQDEVSCMGHELGHVCGGYHIGNSPTAFNLTTVCYRVNQSIDAWRGEE